MSAALIASVTGGTQGVRANDAAPEPFTFVVVPDTQMATLSDDLAPTIHAQTQWIIDQREALNIKFTAQVGDLVESWPNQAMWARVSSAFSRLDAAGVPYSVLPGNHDIQLSTGETPTFDEHFPPSRFANASWNSPEVSYGGYLGSNSFGPDPIDRGNKDNFYLFTAGGLDWVVVNLEFETPTYSLEWAKKVLDAYPNRRAIVVTHGFVNQNGVRTEGVIRTDGGVARSPQEAWRDLIYGSCNVMMVLNGHWSRNGQAEAARTDTNACGTPVHQIVSNYQFRPNGGDGWLRTYTFDPANDQIRARTYSPTLQTWEQDADSEFVISHDLTNDPTQVTEAVVRGGSDWQYRYELGAWPEGWQLPEFDDSAWRAATAPIGWGATTVITAIGFPDPLVRPLSLLARRTFDVAELDRVQSAQVVIPANDGVSVRVNGVEVGRANLNPDAVLSPMTYATAAPSVHSATSTVMQVPVSLLRPTGNVITLEGHLNYTATRDLVLDGVLQVTRSVTPAPQAQPITLTEWNALWRYQFTNNWPEGWTTSGFNDARWRRGMAQLGFGSPEILTNVDTIDAETGIRPHTLLARRTFSIEDADDISDLVARTWGDDGLVLALNGQEFASINMPAGPYSAATYPLSAPTTAQARENSRRITIPQGLLRDGENVLTAVVYLNFRATEDISFDLELTGLAR